MLMLLCLLPVAGTFAVTEVSVVLPSGPVYSEPLLPYHWTLAQEIWMARSKRHGEALSDDSVILEALRSLSTQGPDSTNTRFWSRQLPSAVVTAALRGCVQELSFLRQRSMLGRPPWRQGGVISFTFNEASGLLVIYRVEMPGGRSLDAAAFATLLLQVPQRPQHILLFSPPGNLLAWHASVTIRQAEHVTPYTPSSAVFFSYHWTWVKREVGIGSFSYFVQTRRVGRLERPPVVPTG